MIVFVSLFFVNCDETNDSNQMQNQTSKISVRLMDAPGDYDEVNVEVLDVLIKNSTNSDDQGWISVGNIKPGVYNLLDLTGGVNLLIAENEIPSGYLGQIRLLLGTNNTVMIDNMSYTLTTPSAQQSGLKVKVNQTLEPGIAYDFLLDFDVEHSIVKTGGGSGKYLLHPVIRVSTLATSGAIKGTVTPIGFQVLVSVQVGDGGVITTYTDELGVFQLSGVPEGTYTVKITPDPISGYLEATIPDVVVTKGTITDIGNVVLASSK